MYQKCVFQKLDAGANLIFKDCEHYESMRRVLLDQFALVLDLLNVVSPRTEHHVCLPPPNM
jgi:hypothetical protein